MTDSPLNPETTNGAPGDEGARLKTRAEQAERQRDEYLSLLRQAQADYENAHQRRQREREHEQRFRGERLAADLLPVLDNLERALSSAREAGEESPLAQGVALVHGQLLDALRKHGVSAMNAHGKPFDPNVHEALMQQPSTEFPPGTVIQVLEPGYLIHDRVLRVAKVIISAS